MAGATTIITRKDKYHRITSRDNGKVLGFPLPQSNEQPNNFTGATAVIHMHDVNNTEYTRSLVFNSTTVEWEYSVIGGEFPVGRYWGMVTVTWSGGPGPIDSSQFILDVIQAD